MSGKESSRFQKKEGTISERANNLGSETWRYHKPNNTLSLALALYVRLLQL